MMFRRSSRANFTKGSYAVALIFAIIAMMGFVLMFYSPPYHPGTTPSEQGVQRPAEDVPTSRTSLTGFAWRALLISGAIVGFLIIGARWYKRRFRRSSINSKIEVEVVGRRYISPKHFLLMVDVEGRRLLLGVAENSISLLREFEIAGSPGDVPHTDLSEQDMFSRLLERLSSGDKGVGG